MRRNYILLISFGFLFNTFAQWYQQSVPPNINFLLSVDFSNTLHGAACGYVNENGRAIYTNDSGHTWLNAQVPDSSRALTSVKFINQTTGYIIGAYNLIPSKVIPRENKLPTSIASMRYKLGMTDEVEYKGLFLKTTDGGAAWFTHGTLPDSTFYLINIFFKDINTGFASADFSVTSGIAAILKTSNGGNSWIQVQTPQGIHTLWKILFVNETKGFAVGFKATSDTSFLSVLLKSTDAGESWSETNFSNLENLIDIAFHNENTGFITGAGRTGFVEYGMILKTTDGGVNWFESVLPANDLIFSGVNAINGTSASFVYGKKSPDMIFISMTSNYGENWTTNFIENLFPELTESEIANNENWYICGGSFGGNAVMVKTSSGGIPIGVTSISSNVPTSFEIYQNYPNPFNPSTKIIFEIPPLKGDREMINIKLAVFDVLGKEIATLVNEQLSPGTYEVVWNAHDYPSGVYFYRLVLGDFSAVKKMILMK